jgi:biofilm PGA synthesis N-glycosyltransferase PgaC
MIGFEIIWTLIVVSYIALILGMLLGIRKLKTFQPSKETNIYTKFSIIIPFRNEARNLPDLLFSLIHSDYPLDAYEIYLVNDESSDVYLKIIETFQYQNPNLNLFLLDNIRKSPSPKKDAIDTAIQVCHYDWIISSDADCMFSKDSLRILNRFILEKDPYFVTGMVQMKANQSILQQFQKWDWMSLTGFTMSGFGWQKPLICSGANLSYRKDIFIELGGFTGNEHLASGDDVFLLQKMTQAYPNRVHYLYQPEQMVFTKPLPTWRTVFEQHKRWMAKTGQIKNKLLTAIGLVIFAMNVSWIMVGSLSWINHSFFKDFIILTSVKWSMDLLFLTYTAQKMQSKIDWLRLVFSQIIYPIFSVLVTFSGLLLGFSWKGRRFKN